MSGFGASVRRDGILVGDEDLHPEIKSDVSQLHGVFLGCLVPRFNSTHKFVKDSFEL